MTKEKILINLKKSQTLLDRIRKMVESDQYCVDIMQQNLAVIGLLKSAHRDLMKRHLNSCFRKAMGAKNEKKKQAMIEEILTVTKLYNK